MTTLEGEQPEVVEEKSIEAFAGGFDPLRDQLELGSSEGEMSREMQSFRTVELLKASGLALDKFAEEGEDNAETPWRPYDTKALGYIDIRLSGTVSGAPSQLRWLVVHMRSRSNGDEIPSALAGLVADSPNTGAATMLGRDPNTLRHKDFNFLRGLIRRLTE